MTFNTVNSITIPEGTVTKVTINGSTVWELSADKYTWDAVFTSIDAGTYTTDYAIGDMVPLDLGSEGIFNMQLAAFDTDKLADGSGVAPITWIAKHVPAHNHRMNPSLVTNEDGSFKIGTGTIGGWENSELRTYIKETFLPLIPELVRNRIKTVIKTQASTDTTYSYVTQTSHEDLWIPSDTELGFSNTYESDGKQYPDLFVDNSSRQFCTVGSDTPTTVGSRWSRSCSSNLYGKGYFSYITGSGGTLEYAAPTTTGGIILCFCT